jgi:hypothetical protein
MPVTLREKWRYKFENFMAKGGVSIFISLMVLFFVCLGLAVLARWLVLLIFPDVDLLHDFFKHLWTIFLAMTDPGNMGEDSDASPWLKLTIILAGVLGVIIFSMLIAFITTALDSLIYELRKGRSRVVERGQTLILNWNERVIDILRELIIANESESDAAVVILAEREKEDMDDEIQTHLQDPKTTRIITRKGSPSVIENLRRVNAARAKSVIVLATCTDQASEDERRASDAMVIKTVLALVGVQGGKNELIIVVELFLDSSRALIGTFDDPSITCVDSWDILGKILVQTSRTSGLAVVYNEILSFDGCELYFRAAEWNHIRFGDLLFRFPDGVAMGLRRASGQLLVRPPADTVLESGDEVLLLAEDDSTIEFAERPVAQPRDLPFVMRRLEKVVERELILGWHNVARIIVREYADYLMDGSAIDIVVHHPSERIYKEVAELRKINPGLAIQVKDGNSLDLEELRRLDPFSYNNVIILSQGEDDSPDKTDSETLVILLLMRKIVRDAGIDLSAKKTKLITQILDSENQELVSQTSVDDFVISNKLITMIFAQLSEEPRMLQLYDDLFQEEGSEIYLKPAGLYFSKFPAEVSFADLLGLALKRDGEICLGYRLAELANDPARNFGVKLNPDKNARIVLNEHDSLVVLAEDDL